MSVLRSCIFTILLTINKRFYLFIKPQNLLYLTLAIILFINPLYIFNLGLQLSFSISLSLILMGEYINSFKKNIGKSFCISFISFVVSFPIVINNFYEVNFLSIFYNLFFVPFITILILPLTLISFIFPFFIFKSIANKQSCYIFFTTIQKRNNSNKTNVKYIEEAFY